MQQLPLLGRKDKQTSVAPNLSVAKALVRMVSESHVHWCQWKLENGHSLFPELTSTLLLTWSAALNESAAGIEESPCIDNGKAFKDGSTTYLTA